MSSATAKFKTNVLRTLVLATATPFTIYSIETQKPNPNLEALAQQETLQPVNMSSAPVSSSTVVSAIHSFSLLLPYEHYQCLPQYYNTTTAFLAFLDRSGIPWTILGGFLIIIGILAVQALGSCLGWLYGPYVNGGDSAEGDDEK